MVSPSIATTGSSYNIVFVAIAYNVFQRISDRTIPVVDRTIATMADEMRPGAFAKRSSNNLVSGTKKASRIKVAPSGWKRLFWLLKYLLCGITPIIAERSSWYAAR